MIEAMETRQKARLEDQLAAYAPFDAIEAAHVKQLQQFLASTDNAYDRSNLVGHVVAEAWIVNPARDQVVLLEHGLNKAWVVPGGHCDGDPDVFAAAVREVAEETGLTNITPLLDGGIFDINTGLLTTRERHGNIEPSHLHFDVCFAFEVPHNAPLTISDESTQLRWIPIDAVKNLTTFPGHYRRPDKSNAWLK